MRKPATWLLALAMVSPVLGKWVGCSAPNRPNIVILLSDDMGWGQPGYQGGTRVPTPNLDRLAREGVQLTQFYVQSVCTATRASLLTGRYPFRTGAEVRIRRNDVAGMLTDERTLAQALREAGYFTAILGKWHLGEWKKAHLPLQRGFDHQYGFYSALIDSFTHRRKGILDWHRNEQPLDEDGYSSFLIAAEFDRILNSHGEGPFFIYVPFNAVHAPHQAPDACLRHHEGAWAPQRAQLECMDGAIGRILESLDERGLRDDTLVIFVNDNGAEERIGNGPYRGFKGNYYEGGVRVASVMRWPERIEAGSTVDVPMHVVDIYPTLIRLAGGDLEQPLPLDGVDVWGAIARGESKPRDEIVYNVPGSEDRKYLVQVAIRIGDWKLVGDELYDIAADPYETSDLAATHPDVVRTMKERLAELATQRRRPEVHNKIPGYPPPVYGEEESSSLLSEWEDAMTP